MAQAQLNTQLVPIKDLKPALYNPRRWSKEAAEQLKESIRRFGLVDPLLVNGDPDRKNIVIGGHFRLSIAESLGYKEVPVVYLDIPEEAKEQELNLRLNKNLGDWDYKLLAEFDESLLADVGFDSETLDTIFDIEVDELARRALAHTEVVEAALQIRGIDYGQLDPMTEYSTYVLMNGSYKEQGALVEGIKSRFVIRDRTLQTS